MPPRTPQTSASEALPDDPPPEALGARLEALGRSLGEREAPHVEIDLGEVCETGDLGVRLG